MSFFNCACDALSYLIPQRSPKPASNHLNRVDAPPHLLEYHESGRGPKPAPTTTNFLPLRTRIAANPFSTLGKAQIHAYYEEIDSIPASAVDQENSFSSGCWWVVHPVSCVQVLDLSTKVLMDLRVWLKETAPNEMFARMSGAVLKFKGAREDTLENVVKELEKRRGKGDVGGEEGYTGGWETVGASGEVETIVEGDEDDGHDEQDEEEQKKAKGISRNSAAQLEEAAAAGRRAAEEAMVENEYHVVY